MAAVTLARRQVLVQQLPAVEGLARVDIACFDKTGTLTDGTIAFDRLVRLDDQPPAEAALGNVTPGSSQLCDYSFGLADLGLPSNSAVD